MPAQRDPELESAARLGQHPHERTLESALTRRDWLLVGIAAGLGLCLRVWLGSGELWLDEIWSADFARGLEHWWQVFTLRHDNNHPLNTLMLRLLGPQEHALVQRALPIAAGTLTIVLGAVWSARTASRAAAAPAAALLAASPLLAYYSSEARGYGLALCMAFAAALALESSARTRGLWLGLWTVLGLLSHFSFVFVLAALGVRELWLRRSVLVFLFPLAASLAWYGLFASRMNVGGGDAWSFTTLGRDAAALLLGLEGPIGVGALALLLALLAWSLRSRRADAALLAMLLLFAPLLTFSVLDPAFVALRYFLLPLAFLPALAGGALAARGRLGAALTLLLVLANLVQDFHLARSGRGEYRAAIRWMLEHSPAEQPSVTSDIAFDTRKTLAYHAQFQSGRGLRWVEPAQVGPQGVDWIVIASNALPPEEFADRGMRYRRSTSFEAQGPSAYRWVLYQRVR